MPRPLSSAARAAIFAQETGEAFIFLLELTHPGFADTLRVCNNGENVTSNGQTYLWFPFELTLAGETDDTLPRARLRICNVDRRIVQAVRSVASQPVTARIALVMASTPDTIEAGWFEFRLVDVGYDELTVEGALEFDDAWNEPYPADSFTPSRFPGLF